MKYTYYKKSYTVKQLAREFDVDYYKLLTMLKSGKAVGSAIRYLHNPNKKLADKEVNKRSKTFAYYNKRYTTKEFAETYGLDYKTVNTLIKHGVRPGRILKDAGKRKKDLKTPPKYNKNIGVVNYRKQWYAVPDLAEKVCVDTNTLKAYLDKGLTPGTAVKKARQEKYGKCYSYAGHIYTIPEMSKIFNISESQVEALEKEKALSKMFQSYTAYKNGEGLIEAARRKSGWTESEIKFIPKNISREKYYEQQERLKSIGYPVKPGDTIASVCKEYGVNPNTFDKRCKRGWDPMKALTTPAKESLSNRTAREPIDHLGQKFKNLNAMCEAWNCPRDLFNNRMAIGWSLKDALETPLLVSAGEKKVGEILTKKGVQFIFNTSVRRIFVQKGMSKEFKEFATEYVDALKDIGINVSVEKIGRMRFNFTIIKNGDVNAFVEYDDLHQFKFFDVFHQTIEKFFARHNKDKFKTLFSEMTEIPLLRIRKDQLDRAEEMIDDLLNNPKKYLTQHNTFMSNSEYWKEDESVLSSLNELDLV